MTEVPLAIRFPSGRAARWYDHAMVRSIDLTASVGRSVAVDRDRGVCRDAASVAELSASLESDGVEGAEIMSAPGEPVVSGLD